MYGKSSCNWEVFPCMGSLFVTGKSSCNWEVFPCMGSVPIKGKSPIYGQSCHIWEDFPYLGRLLQQEVCLKLEISMCCVRTCFPELGEVPEVSDLKRPKFPLVALEVSIESSDVFVVLENVMIHCLS